MSNLDFELTRDIVIRATRATVFRYFTDTERWASWWGQGSTVDPRPRGEVLIHFPGDVIVRGEVLEIVDQEQIVFTYGFESGEPIPVGASRVTIRLTDTDSGTKVSLVHALPDAASRDAHVAGWRYQLAVFANVVSNEQHAGVDKVIDRFFAAWSEHDADARRQDLEATTVDDVSFSDAYGCVRGRDELDAHIAAIHIHMPGGRLERSGAPGHCQGTAIADWRGRADDGTPRGEGRNVFDLAPDGRIARVVGIWSS